MEVSTRFHWDDTEEKFHVERVQDCVPIMEQAKAFNREGLHGSKEMRHVARFPMVIVEKYCNVHGITFQEWLANTEHVERMLKDHDLAFFRVAA